MDYDAIGKRIKELRGTSSQKEIASKIGCTSSHLSQVESGTYHPSLKLLEKMAKTWNVPLSWLLTGEETVSYSVREDRTGYDSVDVPLVSDSVAAGSPVIPYDQVHEIIPIPRKMLRSGNSARYVAVRVAGNSMEPVLKDGDIVVVDKSKRTLKELSGKIVVARVEDGIVVKYLSFNPKLDHMHALLVPHNAREYHAMVSTPKSMEESVIGKVVLAISSLK